MPRRPKAFRRIATRIAGAAILALTFAASAAHAQDDDEDNDGGSASAPFVVTINGPCALSVAGRKVACSGVAYMLFPSNHRIDFAAVTGASGWAFSGEEDDNDDGDYALTVDSVVGPSGARVKADGACEMQVGEDRRSVESLECMASTEAGDFVLTASGVIGADEADDDEDGED
jgi:hypothetical protein